MDFIQLIQDDATRWRDLDERVRETSRARVNDPAAWHEACRQLHEYRSPLETLFDRAWAEKAYADKELIEFVVCFLRSSRARMMLGYARQRNQAFA
jgi:hypothetical protein